MCVRERWGREMERESSSLVTLDRSCSATDSRVPYGMTKERDKLREKGGGEVANVVVAI